MKRVFLFLLSAICFQFAHAQGYTPDNLPDVKRVDNNVYVSNEDEVLSSSTVSILNLFLRGLKDTTTVDFAVVVVKAIDPQYNIDEFATQLFAKWGIGAKKDNGLLLLMVMNSHEMVFRTGSRLEGVLPDEVLGRIIQDDMAPLIEKGLTGGLFAKLIYPDEAISAGVKKIIKILEDPAIRNEINPPPTKVEFLENLFEKSPIYFTLSLIVGAFCILFIILILFFQKASSYTKFKQFESLEGFIFATLFIFPVTMLIGNMLFFFIKHILRKKAPYCRRCSKKKSQVFGPERKNDLTPIQNKEIELKSVDHEVWRCSCAQAEVLSYKRNSKYTECRICHAKTYPVVPHYAEGEKIYNCKYCDYTYKEAVLGYGPDYDDDDDDDDDDSLNDSHASSSSSRSSSSSSSSSRGSSGGSRGGGSTGGGGASGSW